MIRFMFRTTIAALAVAVISAAPGYCGVTVGVGEAVITPPIGTPLYGYARAQTSDGVHDDLYARSLVIEGETGVTTVFMTLAVSDIPRPHFDLIRAGVNRETGIPVQNIIISCTHTHSGPQIHNPDEPYQKMFIQRAIESAVTAWKTRVPGRIGVGSASVPGLGMNDRRMLYGGLQADPEAGIIKVEDAKGELIGVAFNYGCHASVLDKYNYKITEDWPYYSIKGIKEKVGKNVWVAYYQSAQGDAKVGYSAELSAVGANIPGRTFEFAEYKGNMMVDAVLEALPSIKTSAHADVAVAEKTYDLPARDGFRLSVAEAQRDADIAKAELEYAEKRTDIYGPRVIDSYKVENYLAGLRLGAAKQFNDPNRPKVIPTIQQAVRVGDAVFVTFPGEVFTEIGLAVKQRSPMEKTFAFGLAGAFDNYLPTVGEFKEEGYASLIAPYSPLAVPALTDTSLALINAVAKPAK